ncbi:phospho-sugar mutase [Cerasicoccus arenae]|uniref:Phosphoglucomutase n=1 Tax=Cerasicoccus arenae TaxID=424488 RepID=A0A8J3D8Z9_9BACT|nr:phospho-sugar mutase [Cerasicoccus arenae]MBK1858334.1 phospho-sugar mutase [Cerasicoccus arenae]GHB90842.1 phosphoglucomutase [Cerasicoccus arenae]
MATVLDKIKQAGADGKLLASSVENLEAFVSGGFLPNWAMASIEELVDDAQWEELNDRFYQHMKFGTGGMRGRTIGKISAKAETGTLGPKDSPEHAAIGTNVLNDFNVARATIGLYRYCAQYLADEEIYDTPKLVIAHDVRYFSRHFCELSASIWTKLGGLAMIFDGPRSTPSLSFAVRNLGATAGVVITASHNPSHDNGFKCYFNDGAQVVSPHAEGIIDLVRAVDWAELPEFLEVDISKVVTLPESQDEAYLDVLEDNVLDPDLLEEFHPKAVFTPIHGTGGVASVPLLKEFGVEVIAVPEQWEMDPRFPTVKSPNPENAEALSMAVAKAKEVGADLVLATDPDDDRMALAAPDRNGEWTLFTGNMTGSMLAEYRVKALQEIGILPEGGTQSAALIKTFVTTPLQEAIAKGNGLKCINTLTGFKWIGEKLGIYQSELEEKMFEEEGIALDYDHTDLSTRVQLLLEYSTFYVFGGEESYGYLASDRVRDKDANAACLMICELAAYLKKTDQTFQEYLDAIHLQYGYHLESLVNLYFEGATGAQAIKNIIASLRSDPPKEIGGIAVKEMIDFGKDKLKDADGKNIPKEDFYFLTLENGYKVAARGSGTEPKIKFYCFACESVGSADELASVQSATKEKLKALEVAIEAEARKRAVG